MAVIKQTVVCLYEKNIQYCEERTNSSCDTMIDVRREREDLPHRLYRKQQHSTLTHYSPYCLGRDTSSNRLTLLLAASLSRERRDEAYD